MKAAILTVFPDLVRPFFSHAMVRIACERGAIEPIVIDIREFATDRYRSVDDYPYGGGPGMVMTHGPLAGAIRHALELVGGPAPVVLMSPQGDRLDQRHVQALATAKRLGGRTTGYDVRPEVADQVRSVGVQWLDLGIDAAGEGGYARELTDAERASNKAMMVCVSGCKSPRLVLDL